MEHSRQTGFGKGAIKHTHLVNDVPAPWEGFEIPIDTGTNISGGVLFDTDIS